MGNRANLGAELESSAFDASAVQILGLRGKERISQLFWFELEIIMRGGEPLPAGATPGAAVTILVTHTSEDHGAVETRRIHGVLDSIRDRLDAHRKHRTYVLRVVPELARLKLVETQEIFLGSSVPEIIAQKLGLHDLAGERLTLNTDGYPKRDFVVQYKESDLAFVSRIAEHLGVSYLFEHGEQGPERVIFTDDVAHGGLRRSIEEIPFRTEGEERDIFFLEVERRMFPTTFMVQDYNYRTPLAEITGAHQLKAGGEEIGNGGGVVEYGTHHKNKDQGDQLARIRAEEQQSTSEVFSGKSAVLGLTAGATPKLTGHPLLEDPRLLILEVEHAASFAAEGSSQPESYRNTFQAISADVRFRPPRVTPRPRITGLVTGMVALGSSGKVGGRAQIDDEGRYVVQLHFDTVTHEGEEKASHPIRMAQPFAGPNHGMHFPLRPGAEVVLAFLDGDPDRPIILGSVPNAIAPSATTAKNASENRIQSASGIVFQFSENK